MPKRDLVKRIDLDDRGGRAALTSGRAASKQYATYVVAFGNSIPAGKAAADYVWTNTSADVTWINSVLANGGMRILFLEGDGLVGTPIVMGTSTTIEGQGESTILRLPTTALDAIQMNNDTAVKNLTIRGGTDMSLTAADQRGCWATGISRATVSNVVFETMSEDFVWFEYSSDCVVANCRIIDCNLGTHSILNGSRNCLFCENYISSSNLVIIRGGVANVASGNTFYSNVNGIGLYDYLDEPGENFIPEVATIVKGNSFLDHVGVGPAIDMDTCERCVVMGNTIEHYDIGIAIDYAAYNNAVGGNIISDSISWSIYMADCESNVVSGNNLSGAQSENMFIEGDADKNLITGNVIRKNLHTQIITEFSPFTSTHGIYLNTSAGMINYIIGNDLRDSGSTANYLDETGENIYQESGKLSTGTATSITIASDAITVGSSSLIRLLPQTGTADDLATINGGYDGQLLVLRTATSGDTITVKDGTGNLQLAGGDFAMDNRNDKLTLIYDADLSQWSEVARSNNA
jgi:parallel beta-helix repeat protein